MYIKSGKVNMLNMWWSCLLYTSRCVEETGYTAYFVELAGKLQDEIIERTAYEAVSYTHLDVYKRQIWSSTYLLGC